VSPVTECRAPVWEPSRGNPGGDCLADATAAVPLGESGRVLPVCGEHADRYPVLVDLPEED
jgi:hypothetical protein